MVALPRVMGNPRDQRIRDQWCALVSQATSEQKDLLAITFFTKILGAEPEVVKDLRDLGITQSREIGPLFSGTNPNADQRGFWQEVKVIFPGLFSEEELDYLAAGPPHSPWLFLLGFKDWGLERFPSLVLNQLINLSIAYK